MRTATCQLQIARPSCRVCGPAKPHTAVAPLQRCQTLRQRVLLRASTEKQGTESVVDDQILDYCSLDEQGQRPLSKKSLGELEGDFLEALRSFYYDGKPIMSNEEFDVLKEELTWQGSKVAVLSSDEQRFLEASLAYSAGKPILNDEQYDALKRKLKQTGSTITAQGPRCSIRSRKMYSDLSVDYLKMTALNLPAALVVLGALFVVDTLTGYQITALLELPEPYGIIIVWGLVLPTILVFATSLTNLVFKDNLILKGPCPSCGAENFTYFGDILTIAGNKGQNTVECGSCKTKLVFDENRREMTVLEEEKQPAAAVKA